MEDIVKNVCSLVGVVLILVALSLLVIWLGLYTDRQLKAEKEFLSKLSPSEKALIQDYKMSRTVPCFRGKKGKKEDGKGA